MELSAEQRKAISDHCLPMSWQMLGTWRQRHLGSAHDEAAVVADWLAAAPQRSQVLAREMVRHLSDRLWRVEPVAGEGVGGSGLRALAVVCGGLRWTLWLQPQPQLRLLRISR